MPHTIFLIANMASAIGEYLVEPSNLPAGVTEDDLTTLFDDIIQEQGNCLRVEKCWLACCSENNCSLLR